jgi:hypothetical protein
LFSLPWVFCVFCFPLAFTNERKHLIIDLMGLAYFI